MPHRFFIPPDWIDPPTVQLQGETARQLRTVLRMKPGDEIIVLDNSGTEFQITLTEVGQNSIVGQIAGQRPVQTEPALQLSLYQGTLKAQKFEWVLQKGTELGLSRFVPTICQRSIINNPAELAKKRRRWQRIIQEAAEQSGRGLLPKLEPAMSLAEAIRHAAGSNSRNLMFWEEADAQTSLKTVLAGARIGSLGLFIGPEGGFTAGEAALARQSGLELVTLGPRILRAETAGLAACAAIFYEMGDWD